LGNCAGELPKRGHENSTSAGLCAAFSRLKGGEEV